MLSGHIRVTCLLPGNFHPSARIACCNKTMHALQIMCCTGQVPITRYIKHAHDAVALLYLCSCRSCSKCASDLCRCAGCHWRHGSPRRRVTRLLWTAGARPLAARPPRRCRPAAQIRPDGLSSAPHRRQPAKHPRRSSLPCIQAWLHSRHCRPSTCCLFTVQPAPFMMAGTM